MGSNYLVYEYVKTAPRDVKLVVVMDLLTIPSLPPRQMMLTKK
jgi:hypothetical protein